MAKKARKGRPRKDADQRYVEGVNVKFLKGQRKIVSAAAKRAGKPLAVWLRELAIAAAESK